MSMEVLDIVVQPEIIKALISGFIIAFLINLTGVGGGALVIPVLSVFFGLAPAIAIGTASVYSTITKVMSCLDHLRRKNVNIKLCMYVLRSAIPSVVVSASLVNVLIAYYPAIEAGVQSTLLILIIGMMVVSAWLVFSTKESAERRPVSGLTGQVGCVGVGLVMGVTGIGGGILLMPLVLKISDEPIKRAVGASILIALVLSGITALIYSSGGQTKFDLLIAMLLGAMIAVPLSGGVSKRLSGRVIRLTTVGLIITSAAAMIANAL